MTTRILPPAEWNALDATELRDVWQSFDPADVRVCVVEEHGRIVAHWTVIRIWHVEALYLERPALFRRLWRLVGQTLRELRVATVWTGAAHGESVVHSMLARVGAAPLPIDHFVLRVTTPTREVV